MFPLWGRNTRELISEMLDAGLCARIVCVDPSKLPGDFIGRDLDHDLLRRLPAGVDPCGENGEFHTFAYAGPMFDQPIPIKDGETVTRDGFLFADVLPDSEVGQTPERRRFTLAFCRSGHRSYATWSPARSANLDSRVTLPQSPQRDHPQQHQVRKQQRRKRRRSESEILQGLRRRPMEIRGGMQHESPDAHSRFRQRIAAQSRMKPSRHPQQQRHYQKADSDSARPHPDPLCRDRRNRSPRGRSKSGRNFPRIRRARRTASTRPTPSTADRPSDSSPAGIPARCTPEAR